VLPTVLPDSGMSILAGMPFLPPSAAGPHAWVWLLLLVACAVATATDLRSMRIPNWLTFPLFGLGLAHGAMLGGWSGMGDALIGAAIAGGIFIGAFILAGGGAGDAKLMMGLGAWLGSSAAVPLVLGVTATGFALGMGVTVARGGLRDIPVVLMHGLWITRLEFGRALAGRIAYPESSALPSGSGPKERPKQWMPYAPAILVGTALTWWWWETRGGGA
jgi:prepilin peptidase CpaA